MKKALSLGTIIVSVTLLSACGNSTPSCSSDKAMEVVKKIASNTIESELELSMGQATLLTYSVNTIRTKNINEKTGASECAADLVVEHATRGEKSFPITYTVESTEKSGEVYVEVFGL